jgi:hypothetical protein
LEKSNKTLAFGRGILMKQTLLRETIVNSLFVLVQTVECTCLEAVDHFQGYSGHIYAMSCENCLEQFILDFKDLKSHCFMKHNEIAPDDESTWNLVSVNCLHKLLEGHTNNIVKNVIQVVEIQMGCLLFSIIF